nr:zinc finger CCCH domain-containing protein 4-like [Ipomoea batatas]
MRIRKHAKVSPLTYAASSLKPGALLHAHICHLNQSPWDVITFPPEEREEEGSSSMLLPPPAAPPPPHSFLFDGCESYPPNGSFNDSNEAVQSPDSAMFSPGWDYSNRIAAAAGYSAAEDGAAEAEEATILCCKTDGKAWQCKREAKDGHTFCDHHLEQLKHYNNLAHPTRTAVAAAVVKKSEKQTPPPPPADDSAMTTRCRRARPKKPSVSTNPYELYYYTGFGPLWGKKRGPGRASGGTTSSTAAASEHDQRNGASSSASEMDDGEFDYVEDEYEDDEEDEVDDGKRKKACKPIKARSLKSLM